MSRFGPVRTCCVCGIRLPDEKRELLIARGCATSIGSGQTIFHCKIPIHSQEDIIKMISAVPLFSTGKEYRKYATDPE